MQQITAYKSNDGIIWETAEEAAAADLKILMDSKMPPKSGIAITPSGARLLVENRIAVINKLNQLDSLLGGQ